MEGTGNYTQSTRTGIRDHWMWGAPCNSIVWPTHVGQTISQRENSNSACFCSVGISQRLSALGVGERHLLDCGAKLRFKRAFWVSVPDCAPVYSSTSSLTVWADRQAVLASPCSASKFDNCCCVYLTMMVKLNRFAWWCVICVQRCSYTRTRTCTHANVAFNLFTKLHTQLMYSVRMCIG